MEEFEVLIKNADGKYKVGSYTEFDIVLTPHTKEDEAAYVLEKRLCSDIEYEKQERVGMPMSIAIPNAAAVGIDYLEGRLTREDAEAALDDKDDVSYAVWSHTDQGNYRARMACGDVEMKPRTARTCCFHRLSWCKEGRCHTRLEAERARECVLLCLLLVEEDGKISVGPRTREGARIQCFAPTKSAYILPKPQYRTMWRDELESFFKVQAKKRPICNLSVYTEMAVRSLLLDIFCILYCFLPAGHKMREGEFRTTRQARAALLPRKVLKSPGGVAQRIHNLLAHVLHFGEVQTSPRAFRDDPFSWVLRTPLVAHAERARDDDEALTYYVALNFLLAGIPGACLESLDIVRIEPRREARVQYELKMQKTTKYCDVPLHAWLSQEYGAPQVGTDASKGMRGMLGRALEQVRAGGLLRIRKRAEHPAVRTYASVHALMGFVCNGLKEVASVIVPYRAPRKSFLLVVFGDERLDDSAVADIEASRLGKTRSSFLGTCVVRLTKAGVPLVRVPEGVRRIVEAYLWGSTQGTYVAIKPRSATREMADFMTKVLRYRD
ncbi:VP4 [Great Island virus]|uniref:VP4 n=1 Tax=Great Island virus TaxID=204269 RepID=E1AA93_9REOV|nr:VP4 [Great Island virus]ADM88596.1 VP4 [Great Island virus]